MIKSFGLSSIRRATAPAFFFSVLFALGAFGARELDAQTYVTNNGIIMERVAEEDVREVERLNEESEAEDERERARLAELRAAGEAEGDSEQEATEDIEEADAIDELFGDDSEGDTETAVTTPTTEIVKIDKKDKPVEFSGDLSAELGGYFYLYPWKKSKPFATFSNTLKFVGRPRNDFYVYGSFVTSFPEMDFGVYELYFDYTLFGRADIRAGKMDISWALSRMLYTNIIEDECLIITAEDAFHRRNRKSTDSKFTLSASVPIFSYLSIQGLAQYESNALHDDTMADYISVVGKVEGNLKNFSISVLGKRWAKSDNLKYDPCVGAQIVSTILGKNSSLFVQGLTHFSVYSKALTRAQVTAGLYKYFSAPIMLGLAFEYQGSWGRDEIRTTGSDNFTAEEFVAKNYSITPGSGDKEKLTSLKNIYKECTVAQYKGFEHLFAAEIGWSHFILTKKFTFGCKWFHDYRGEYGAVAPGIIIDEILPHVTFKSTAPIYYGSQQSYSLVIELVLNLKY